MRQQSCVEVWFYLRGTKGSWVTIANSNVSQFLVERDVDTDGNTRLLPYVNGDSVTSHQIAVLVSTLYLQPDGVYVEGHAADACAPRLYQYRLGLYQTQIYGQQ